MPQTLLLLILIILPLISINNKLKFETRPRHSTRRAPHVKYDAIIARYDDVFIMKINSFVDGREQVYPATVNLMLNRFRGSRDAEHLAVHS